MSTLTTNTEKNAFTGVLIFHTLRQRRSIEAGDPLELHVNMKSFSFDPNLQDWRSDFAGW